MNNAQPTSTAGPAPFVVTKQYRRFAEFCDACRRDRYIGLCYGPPGVGKTFSARHYAQWHLLEAVEPRWYSSDRVMPAEIAHCRTVFYTPPVANTPRGIEQTVRELRYKLTALVEEALQPPQAPEEDEDPGTRKHYDHMELLMVDEVDRLKLTGLEQLRDLYDRGAFGMILMGMPGLEKRLARYAQLYSRVGFAHAFRPLSPEEMGFLLEHHWAMWGLTFDQQDFTDTEAVAAIIRVTGGNFRLLHRLFAQIGRILTISGLHTITKEVVEAARECLVIGTT